VLHQNIVLTGSFCSLLCCNFLFVVNGVLTVVKQMDHVLTYLLLVSELVYDVMCSEQLIKSTADALVDRGLLAAGYKHLVIGDCWMDRKRTTDGKLQGDRQRFPSGMPTIVQYVSTAHCWL